MKSEFLKLAGVKSEKAFYKKYPTEAAFFKAHPEAKKSMKKAQSGFNTDANNNGIPDYLELNPPTSNQAFGPQNQWNFGSNMSSTPSFGAPSVQQMAGNTFQSSGDPFAMQNYGQQWGQQNPLPANNPNSQFSNGVFGSGSTGGSSKGEGFNFQGFGNVISGTMQGMQQIEAEKKLRRKMETWADVSGVVKDAAVSNKFAKKPKRQWLRPDDPRFVHNASEKYNTQGRGTDILATQNGGGIGGNPTEVQNTYAPEHTLFDDLGYEPLQNDQQIKAFAGGGGFGQWWGQTNAGLSGNNNTSFMSNVGQGSPFDSTIGGMFGNSGGYSAGSSFGSLFGPLGSLAGGVIGGMLDDEPSKTAAAQSKLNFNNDYISRLDIANGITSGLSSMHVGENGANLDGGWVSHDWQPQVIATFGEHKVKDLLRPPHDADMLRAGGHLREYTAPSARAMEIYENGGEINSEALDGKLKSHWGGKVEDISYNPYLPGSGKTAMIKGASHKDGGVGISYGNGQNGYQGYAANGADMEADIEAELNEPVIEMAEGGSINSNADTKAVVYGNIPLTKTMAATSDNETVKRLANNYNGWSMKKIIADRTKDEIKAGKNIEKAATIANKADANTKWGKLETGVAKIMKDSGDISLQMIADEKIALADFQDYLQNIKQHLSYARGKNVSAEAVGRGTIKGKPITMKDVLDGKIDDRDPITKDAEIENPYAKYGAFLNKAQSGIGWKNALDSEEDNYYNDEVVAEEPAITPINANQTAAPNITEVAGTGGSGSGGDITEEQYNDFVKKYESSKSTKGKKNKDTLEFQRAYHKAFPKEALAAIQKTTRENGLSNKAKAMGLTVQDILEGKDVARILESNEDEYHGPRTDQYMASVRSHFKQVPDLKLNTLGGTPTTTTSNNTNKRPIEIVPYKGNNVADVFNIFSSLFQRDNIPGIDPRQFAGEYMSIAQNQYEPVPLQQYATELDPVYRVSYQDVRDQNTADFRDVQRNLGYNPAALAGLLGKKYIANNAVNAEEFRTNQAIENQIYGGNRAKINQQNMANIQLRADQMNKQELAKSKTKETQQKAVASMADKAMKYDTDVLKYKIQRNLFPNFGFGANGRTYTQGPFYKPVIPQVYGGKGTIEEVPVKDANGNILYYKMIETGQSQTPPLATPPFIPGQGYVAKNGKSIVKNAKNGSVVKSYKNL